MLLKIITFMSSIRPGFWFYYLDLMMIHFFRDRVPQVLALSIATYLSKIRLCDFASLYLQNPRQDINMKNISPDCQCKFKHHALQTQKKFYENVIFFNNFLVNFEIISILKLSDFDTRYILIYLRLHS